MADRNIDSVARSAPWFWLLFAPRYIQMHANLRRPDISWYRFWFLTVKHSLMGTGTLNKMRDTNVRRPRHSVCGVVNKAQCACALCALAQEDTQGSHHDIRTREVCRVLPRAHPPIARAPRSVLRQGPPSGRRTSRAARRPLRGLAYSFRAARPWACPPDARRGRHRAPGPTWR